MRVEYINPFIVAAGKAFSTMLNCEIRRERLSLKDAAAPQHEISGIIGMSGNAVGTVVLSFSEELALKAAGTMLMTEFTAVTADVVDAVGELTNMVAGAAKAQLEELHLSISLPNVVTGKGHEIRFPSNAQPITVSFSTEWGPFSLEVGLETVVEAATT